MDEDFGADFFENEDYGAFLEDDGDTFGDGQITTMTEGVGAAVSRVDNTTAGALEEGVDIVLPPVKVVNCVVAFHTDCEIDLRLITVSARNVEYNPRKLNAAILRYISPRVTSTIFPSGRVTLCGRAPLAEMKKRAKVTAKLIQKAGHPEARFTDFKVNTLICTAYCGFSVRLENLAQDHASFCSFEPEIFCGVIYRYNPSASLKATVLIFVSGRLVICGCKQPEVAQEIFKALYAVLYQYRI